MCSHLLTGALGEEAANPFQVLAKRVAGVCSHMQTLPIKKIHKTLRNACAPFQQTCLACFESTSEVFRRVSDVESGGVQVLSGGWYERHQSSSLCRQTAGGRTGPAVQGTSL